MSHTECCPHCGNILIGTPREKLHKMMEIVAEKYGATFGEIIGTTRAKYVVNARRAIVMILHESGMSANAIGRLMHRDHTTILHAIKCAKQEREELEQYLNQLPKVPLLG